MLIAGIDLVLAFMWIMASQLELVGLPMPLSWRSHWGSKSNSEVLSTLTISQRNRVLILSTARLAAALVC